MFGTCTTSVEIYICGEFNKKKTNTIAAAGIQNNIDKILFVLSKS